MSDKGDMPTARFIAEAREGWPEAIRRAMVAEQGMEEAEARLVADELEALDFLWQEYGQADPATLTEDAKELAAKVRQKVRELAGVEGLEAERDGLKARLTEVEAQVVAMRQALAEAIRGLELVHPMDLAEPCAVYEVWQQCKAALSSNAGRETARRLRLLEELVEAATAFVERCTLVECLPQTEDAICDEDPCLKERLKVLVRVLKGGNDDAGTGS